MTYVFSMSSRMVTIAVTCAVLLCALLFLMGVEIGARLARPGGPQGAAPLAMAPAATAVQPAIAPVATTPQPGTAQPAITVGMTAGMTAAPAAPSTP
ncbi:hypothetical protein ACIP1U_26310 [Cupriavidus sp. NPDC089707]|uniref:hypothetical protein n=1 Tax=Cupriavidus sp. NPDC089707 TaxID=3363963 RepID=UPI003824413A